MSKDVIPGALIITTVSGFLPKFESDNVRILQSLGLKVHYAANPKDKIYEYPEGIFEKLGVSFHPVCISKSPYKIISNLKALTKVRRILDQENIELIHCHTPTGGLVGRLATLWTRRRNGSNVHVIYTAHGLHFYKGAPLKNHLLYGTAERLLAHLTDDIILINKEDYDTAGRFRLKRGGRAWLIPGVGLDREEFRPYTEEEKTQARNKLSIGEDVFLMVSAGELNENKNHLAVIEALHRMSVEGIAKSNIKYVIAGEGPLKKFLDNKIREYGIENIVRLYGYCPSRSDASEGEIVLQDLLGAADAFCFPSRREGLGMAALEALAMGIPILAADNRGSREYLQEGKNGYTCVWNDIDGWVDIIKRIISADKMEKVVFSKCCRASTKKFDKANTRQKMKTIYEQAVRAGT